MTGMGFDTEPPETELEEALLIVVSLTGFILYASVVGNLAAIVNKGDFSTNTFVTKMAAVNRYMTVQGGKF